MCVCLITAGLRSPSPVAVVAVVVVVLVVLSLQVVVEWIEQKKIELPAVRIELTTFRSFKDSLKEAQDILY